MNQISNTVLVYIDAMNVKSIGGKNHLINILNFAPDKLNNKKAIYTVWGNPNFLKELPSKQNIHYKSNIFGRLPLPFKLLWNFIVFRLICYLHRPNHILCSGGLLFFPHPNSAGIFQNVHPFLPEQVARSPLVQKIRLHFLLKALIYSSKNFTKHVFQTYHSYKIMSAFLNDRQSYKVIPHAIDSGFRVSRKTVISRINNLEKKIDQNKKITYTYVSSAEPYKNHIKLIDSFNVLHANSENFELNFILSDGPVLSSILEKINQCDFKDNINLYFNSNKEKVVDILHNQTDIGLFVSSCETFGLILVENMASGLPIFSIKESCIPEILGDNSFYFDIKNPKSLYNKILYNFKNFENFQKYSLLAWERSHNYYWEKSVNDTWDFISR